MVEEYIMMVCEMVGVDVEDEVCEWLLRDFCMDGFNNMVYNFIVDLKYIEVYVNLVFLIV